MSLFICELLQKPITAAGNRKSKAARKFHVNRERNKKVLGADMFLSGCPSRPHRRLLLDKGPEACRVETTGVVEQPQRTLGSYPTDKTFRVPQGVQGRNVVFQDSPGTASALGSKHVKVVLAAVGFAVLLMKSCQGRTKSISS